MIADVGLIGLPTPASDVSRAHLLGKGRRCRIILYDAQFPSSGRLVRITAVFSGSRIYPDSSKALMR